MILIDANNRAIAAFFAAMSEMKDDERWNYNEASNTFDSIKRDFTRLYLSIFFNELLDHKKKYHLEYGRVVVAWDEGNNWRRRIYSGYKQKRRDISAKQSANEKFINTLRYKYMELAEHLIHYTTFINLKLKFHVSDSEVYGIEADDIIGVLTRYPEKHVIISPDQDFIQVLSKDVRQYHPMHKKLSSTPSQKVKNYWIQKCIISGQSKDTIPAIDHQCKLHKDFIKYMKDKFDITVDNTMIPKLVNSQYALDYIEEKEIQDLEEIQQGKRKRQVERTIFQSPRWGDNKIQEFIEDLDDILENDECLRKAYERNKLLVRMDYIPDDIANIIDVSYETALEEKKSKLFNPSKLLKILQKYNVSTLIDRLIEF